MTEKLIYGDRYIGIDPKPILSQTGGVWVRSDGVQMNVILNITCESAAEPLSELMFYIWFV